MDELIRLSAREAVRRLQCSARFLPSTSSTRR